MVFFVAWTLRVWARVIASIRRTGPDARSAHARTRRVQATLQFISWVQREIFQHVPLQHALLLLQVSKGHGAQQLIVRPAIGVHVRLLVVAAEPEEAAGGNV